MVRSLLDDDRFKLQFAGHETFPPRYGWIKKAYDEVVHAQSKGVADTNSVFLDDSAISLFGVGKNMVLSMRHWALAADVLHYTKPEDGARQGHIAPTPFGRLLFGDGGDPYLEHPASLWLIHWHFAAKPGRATTWYWAFNELSEASIDRELLTERLSRRIAALREAGRMKESRITETTIRRDVECFVRTYLVRAASARGVHEDNLESPMSELALLQPLGIGNAFRFRRGPQTTLPDEVFLFGLLSFWRDLYPTRREFSVEAVTHETGSPGRVFLLDEESVAERLSGISDLTGGAIQWDESSGLRQIYAHDLGAIDTLDLVGRLYRRTLHARAA